MGRTGCSAAEGQLKRSCGTTADHMMQRPHSLPPLAKGGGGAEVGPYMLIYSSEDQGLYVEGHRLLVVGDENIIFLRGPEAACVAYILRKCGRASMSSDRREGNGTCAQS